MEPEIKKINKCLNTFSEECNTQRLQNEKINREDLQENPNKNEYLYPTLNDPNFNIKIAQKKEFNDNKYDGTIRDIKEYANKLSNAEFELSSHQAFVRNFMSFQTPYNSLLLYHGLGSGKCHKINTPILLFNDKIKMVQDLLVGDVLMGDDQKSRVITSLARGRDKMYDVIQSNGDTYTCNEEHILCLKAPELPIIEESINKRQYKILWIEDNFFCSEIFDYDIGNQREIYSKVTKILDYLVQNSNSTVFEISIERYLNLSEERRYLLKGYKLINNECILSDIKVKYVNKDDYYGFTLTGNGRYLLGDHTVTHNTCSAIGVTEEMRDYNRQMGISKRIIIVANPNVQDNFKLQLFDERKLKIVDGIWTIKGCIGNKILKEINPTNMKGLTKEKIVSQVKTLIHASYSFMGYIQFSNEITKIVSQKNTKLLQNEFNNRLIVIDEVHNIRISDDVESKDISKNLMHLVMTAQNVRLLLLSATPMFNNYKEIIWLLNLMNVNDRRGVATIKQIFDKDGNFRKDENGKQVGRDLFIQKVTGYISFVRGENPYTFPFRVYPNMFAPQNTFQSIEEYPKYQMNCKKIPDNKKINKIILYLTKIGQYQEIGYKYIIYNLRKKKGLQNASTDSFGYNDLQIPLESLNIVYPYDGLENVVIENCKTEEEEEQEKEEQQDQEVEEENIDNVINDLNNLTLSGGSNSDSASSSNSNSVEIEQTLVNVKYLTGSDGLKRIMNYVDSKTPFEKGSFEYKNTSSSHIFSPEQIGKYSSKIKNICENIYNSATDKVSSGIILIYSAFIDGGIIPISLALEEMGFTRYGQNVKPLFKTPPTPVVDVRTMKPPTNKRDFKPARYVLITGDARLSPNNDLDVKAVTNDDNLNGDKIKVVLISQAGSEGIDFKAVRQVHILDPWYNMNQNEQVIGRAVRNLSHKLLPFEQRNVEIFMHATILTNAEEESADLYVYRIAELKAIQIGKVSRLLKQTAVDCIINHEQTDFTAANFQRLEENQNVTQILSTGQELTNFEVGDIPNSATCDYMETCEYQCLPNDIIDDIKTNLDTYSQSFMTLNSDKIILKIKELMKHKYFYKKKELFYYLNTPTKYPIAQIYAALTQMIEDTSEYIIDRYGRTGYLINIGEYYLFQPSELNYNNISIYDRSVPLDFKHTMIKFDIKKDIETPVEKDKEKEKIKDINGVKIIEEMRVNYDTAKTTSKVTRGEENWYKYCGSVITKMKDSGVPIDYLQDFLIEHLIESLMYNEKIYLLNYLFMDNDTCVEQPNQKDAFLTKIKKYLCDKILHYKGITAIVLFNGPSRKDNLKIYILKDHKWMPAEPEDIRDLMPGINEKYKLKTNLNNYVGFMGFEDKNKYMVFKVKNTQKTRHTGSRCDQSGKKKTIELLNEIVGEEKYTKENTKGEVQQELCILQEFTLRYFERIKKDNKTWFLPTELAVISEF